MDGWMDGWMDGRTDHAHMYIYRVEFFIHMSFDLKEHNRRPGSTGTGTDRCAEGCDVGARQPCIEPRMKANEATDCESRSETSTRPLNP